ncbi:MAG: FAD:protein FMN transferase [Tissierellia bacterium]|nr:FAD:protein FMN transferase [Tissierellia bacterium]
MKKRLLLVILLILTLTGCNSKSKERVYDKHSYTFFNTFDTVVRTVMYVEDEKKAEEYNNYIESRFNELHKEFNKYDKYEGINNVKTINENAGIAPVKVSDDLFDLIKISLEYSKTYTDETDISLGSVLEVWSKYRDINEDLDPSKVYESSELLPSLEELEEANKYVGVENIELDEKNKTVFIKNPNFRIDVGATAKGYAVEIVGNELEKMGCDSLLISAGGNVKAIGQPLDGLRGRWGIGIMNPDVLYGTKDESNIVETIFVKDLSVVTSGDYQRYFIVDNKNYHHLIDRDTLQPGEYFRGVTVVHEDSGLADFLSTAVFLMPYEEGLDLIESIEGAECYWIFLDDSVKYTDGMKKMMLSEGATGAK